MFYIQVGVGVIIGLCMQFICVAVLCALKAGSDADKEIRDMLKVKGNSRER